MPLALLPEARVVLQAGRHGVRDARAGCPWLLDRVRSSVVAVTGGGLGGSGCVWRASVSTAPPGQ